MNKILLYFKIRKFYNIFGKELGGDFITKLSDMTADNVYDVLFDINEVRGGYDEDEMMTYLNKLDTSIRKFHYHLVCPIDLNTILFHICNRKVNGFYEARPHTEPIYKLAQWLYKKGVM